MLKSTSTDFGSLSSRRTATCNFLTAFPIDYLELGGHGMLHFQIQGALVFRQLNHTGYVVLTKDLSYKEKEGLSLHSQEMNQQKDTIKELKLREESSMSSKSHELTGHV